MILYAKETLEEHGYQVNTHAEGVVHLDSKQHGHERISTRRAERRAWMLAALEPEKAIRVFERRQPFRKRRRRDDDLIGEWGFEWERDQVYC